MLALPVESGGLAAPVHQTSDTLMSKLHVQLFPEEPQLALATGDL